MFKRFLLLGLLFALTSPVHANQNSQPALIKKKCVNSEILEVCVNDHCTQAPCINDTSCKETNTGFQGTSCLSEEQASTELMRNSTINLKSAYSQKTL